MFIQQTTNRLKEVEKIKITMPSQEEPKTTIDFVKEIIFELHEQYSKYPAGEKIRYEAYLGEDESDDEENIKDYESRVEALNQLQEEGIVLDYIVGSKTEDIMYHEYAGTRIEYKIAKCLINKVKLQEHIDQLSGFEKNPKESNDNLNDEYRQSLFLLKTFYSKIMEISAAFAGGDITFRNPELNHYYTILNALVDDILSKKEFAELKNEKPALFESLIGDIEHYDTEWEFGSKPAYDFLGRIEKLYILSGVPITDLPDELKTFFQKIDEAMTQHRKHCDEQLQKMEKRADKIADRWKKNNQAPENNSSNQKNNGDISNDKILNALNEAIVRGLEAMFNEPQAQQSVQKIEIVSGKMEIEGLQEGLRAITQKEPVGPKFPHKIPAGVEWSAGNL